MLSSLASRPESLRQLLQGPLVRSTSGPTSCSNFDLRRRGGRDAAARERWWSGAQAAAPPAAPQRRRSDSKRRRIGGVPAERRSICTATPALERDPLSQLRSRVGLGRPAFLVRGATPAAKQGNLRCDGSLSHTPDHLAVVVSPTPRPLDDYVRATRLHQTDIVLTSACGRRAPFEEIGLDACKASGVPTHRRWSFDPILCWYPDKGRNSGVAVNMVNPINRDDMCSAARMRTRVNVHRARVSTCRPRSGVLHGMPMSEVRTRPQRV